MLISQNSYVEITLYCGIRSQVHACIQIGQADGQRTSHTKQSWFGCGEHKIAEWGWLTMEEKHRPVGQAAANGGHQFTVVGREHLLLDGARNVISFSPEEVLLETTVGALVIKGQNLHIQQLNLDEGRVVVDGSFVSLTYAGENFSQKGKSFLHRMLR